MVNRRYVVIQKENVMGWLTTQVESHGSAFENMLIESMSEAGIYDAVFALCGQFGVRRFMIRFTSKGHSIEVGRLRRFRCSMGAEHQVPLLPKICNRLKQHSNLQTKMASWAPWQEGTLGVVRNCDNKMQVIPFLMPI